MVRSSNHRSKEPPPGAAAASIAARIAPVIMAAYLSILVMLATVLEPLEPSEAAAELSRRTYEVVADGRWAYAATTAGLTIYDAGEASSPRLAATLLLPGSANGLTLSDGLVFLALGPEGLRIVDVGQPEAPKLIGAIDTDG